MATKQAIKNLVELINQKYRFADERNEYRFVAQLGFKGWSIALVDSVQGGHMVEYTQHQEVSANMCLLILKMFYYDILERQALGHYTVSRRA